MVDYSLIKNQKLRQLIILSESIASLPEGEQLKMIERIAQLPPEGETAMIAALEDEQEKIRQAKRAKGITPEMELEQIKQNTAAIFALKRQFDTAVVRENEKSEKANSDVAAEDILKTL